MAYRFLNICDPQRHLVTPDPDSETYLPVDDIAWDAGVSNHSMSCRLAPDDKNHRRRDLKMH